jgi:uncharacterized protein (TIGR03083 family)
VGSLLDRHRTVCADFADRADAVPDDRWDAPTPCSEWDARALVEHVIGFHEVLLLRPNDIKAHRPREGPAARWRATQDAMFGALSEDVPVVAALTTDVLVHTWDLAVATGLDPSLDPELVAAAYESAQGAELPRTSGMFGAEVPVGEDAPIADRLVALYGRDPHWTP